MQEKLRLACVMRRITGPCGPAGLENGNSGEINLYVPQKGNHTARCTFRLRHAVLRVLRKRLHFEELRLVMRLMVNSSGCLTWWRLLSKQLPWSAMLTRTVLFFLTPTIFR